MWCGEERSAASIKVSTGMTVPRINGEACAQRDVRVLAVIGNAIADAGYNLLRALVLRFRQDQRELNASMPCTGVDNPRVKAKHIPGAAQCPGSNLVPELVIDLLETIQIKQKECEESARPACSLYFHFERIDEAPVIGETGDGIGQGQALDILKKVNIIEERPTEKDSVAAELKNCGQGESCMESAVRLSGGERAPEINCGCKIKGKIKKIKGGGSVF